MQVSPVWGGVDDSELFTPVVPRLMRQNDRHVMQGSAYDFSLTCLSLHGSIQGLIVGQEFHELEELQFHDQRGLVHDSLQAEGALAHISCQVRISTHCCRGSVSWNQ